jgi:uncharacterized protein (TIGR03066 family)
MRSILGGVAMLFLTTGLTAADEQVDLSKIVGKWDLMDAKKGQPMTLEFTMNRKISVTVGDPGKEVKIEGTYDLAEHNKLSVALKFNDEDIRESLTIKKLTDEELVTEDSKGKTGTMKRRK